MLVIIQIAGICVIIYFLLIGIIMLYTESSIEDARKMISSCLLKNGYKLSRDLNYIQVINKIIKDILGESRYEELCNLNTYSSIIQFCDSHDGLPSVKITLNCNEENEKKRLETILDGMTKQYLQNYGDLANVKLLLNWSQNETLKLPMLNIIYSRNEKERKMLDAFKQSQIGKISAKYGEVLDDTEDIL